MAVKEVISGARTLVPIPIRGEEPRIEVLRDGEVVRTIRISCSCGCEMDINCEYEEVKDHEGEGHREF